MQKTLITIVAIFSFISLTYSQSEKLTPGNNPIDKNLIKAEITQMRWSMFNDSEKIEIGKVTTNIKKTDDKVFVITKVDMTNATSQWVDSTVAKINNLAPVYHSSYNQNRDMVLHFGETVSGYYFDKKNKYKNICRGKYHCSVFR